MTGVASLSPSSRPTLGGMGSSDDLESPAAGLRNQLNAWDFIGVFDPEINADEYDCMIPPLLERLAAGEDESAIARWLRREIEDHFGMDEVSISAARPHLFAKRLVAWWKASSAEPG